MFSEFIDDRNRFSSDYESMADAFFHPSSHLHDWNFPEPATYSAGADDFADAVDYEGMMDLNDDLLLPEYIKFDIEKQPQLLNLVSPNDILPINASVCIGSLADPFVRTTYGNEMFSNMIPDDLFEVKPSADIQEDLEQMHDDDDAEQFLDDKIINEMAKDGAVENLIEVMGPLLDERDIGPLLDERDIGPLLDERDIGPLDESDSCDSTTMSRKTYHPDYDHCYSKLNEDKDDVWTSAGSPGSSGSSSEVDVVTVTEELRAPFVPKVQVPLRKRQKRGQKTPKGKKNQNSLSPKTFNAAMKRNMTRITTIRRTYRRKINNSVETTPSNSLPSSAPSSRCSSDVEDAGKRANHNSSERKRREVLRTNLQGLRLCVPSVANNPKAPKVVILNSSTDYVGELVHKDQDYSSMKKNLKSKRRFLEMKLKSLRAEMGLS